MVRLFAKLLIALANEIPGVDFHDNGRCETFHEEDRGRARFGVQLCSRGTRDRWTFLGERESRIKRDTSTTNQRVSYFAFDVRSISFAREIQGGKKRPSKLQDFPRRMSSSASR